MSQPVVQSPALPSRDLEVLRTPALWPTWPVLALVRRSKPGESELGVLLAPQALPGLTSPDPTVVHANLFLLPRTLGEFLDLPRETFATFEDLVASGWRVD